ncbi:MAG: hypothetical protein U9O20_02150 [Patescibacteria group bacterium]|nr:hypothetical protein [Patescibacteria group bacterium]
MNSRTEEREQKNSFEFHFRSNWHWWLLAVIVMFSFFLRVYNFEDFLLVRSDQIRDATFAQTAFEKGPGDLRLLGPRMGDTVKLDNENKGDEFHLGPIYYYFQYLSSLIFSSVKPWVFAVPDLFFSTLAIFIFFLLSRCFFNKKISLAITTTFAFSFILIQYSRFAWNTNQLIFWELLFILGMWRASFEKDKLKAGLWLLVCFFALAVVTQLHLIAFFGFPLLTAIFWLFFRPKNIKLKYWFASAIIFILVYSPVIISDFANKGDNIRRFVANLQIEKEEKPVLAKLQKVIEREGEFYALALTSFNDKELAYIEKIGTIFFLLSFIFFGSALFFKKRRKKLSRKKRSFMALTIIWTLVFFALYYKIFDRLERPRYFLSIAPLPFLVLAYCFELFCRIKTKRAGMIITAFIVLLGVISNLYALIFFYKTLSSGEKQEMSFRNVKMRPFRERITHGHINESITYMTSEAEPDKNICYYFSNYQSKSSIKYLGKIYHPEKVFKSFGSDEYLFDCKFFVITRKNKKLPENYRENFVTTGSREFKSLTVRNVEPKRELLYDKKSFKLSQEKKKEKDSKILTWKDVFSKKSN